MKTLHRAQQGFVSIIAAMVIMVFVSLLALGFAYLARQNHLQNQNRLLSTQAFYAAEAGVNDAVDYLTKTLAANPNAALAPKTTCGPIGGAVKYPTTVGSNNLAVQYTCVLYDTAPTSLNGSAGSDQSKVVRVQAQNGTLTSVTISWQDPQNSSQFVAPSGTALHGLSQDSLTAGDPNNIAFGTGILRVTLIPIIPVAGIISRASLTTNAQTVFLYPNGPTNAATVTQSFLSSAGNISDGNQGVIVNGNCNAAKAPRHCQVTINNLSNLGATDTFYLRLRTMYRASSDFTITATSTTNNPAHLINDQVVVDSTGKANDVLRRIQVSVPLTADSDHPEFAIESLDSLCKRIQVWPGGESTNYPVPGNPSTCNPFN